MQQECGIAKNSGQPRKIIIDTDPGIDDALAILMAFQSPELEVVGLTTVFGNNTVSVTTRNALHLCEVAGFVDMPVAEGCAEPMKAPPPEVDESFHGRDGLGNICPPDPKIKKIQKTAVDFLIDKVKEYPGEITIVALGPLTNIAQAIQKEKTFASSLQKLFVLGGSFFASGNVNPAAEANVYWDAEGADIVFTSGADAVVIGIDLCTQIRLSERDLCEIRDSKGRFSYYIYEMCQFFQSDNFEGVFLYDAACLASVLKPSLYTYKCGAVRVETEGICRGHTILDMGSKKWIGTNAWMDQPHICVGRTVDAQGLVALVKERLKRP